MLPGDYSSASVERAGEGEGKKEKARENNNMTHTKTFLQPRRYNINILSSDESSKVKSMPNFNPTLNTHHHRSLFTIPETQPESEYGRSVTLIRHKHLPSRPIHPVHG